MLCSCVGPYPVAARLFSGAADGRVFLYLARDASAAPLLKNDETLSVSLLGLHRFNSVLVYVTKLIKSIVYL